MKNTLPEKSVLRNNGEVYEYIDSYNSQFIDKNKNIDSTEIGKTFFKSAPKWVESLFIFRDRIVKLIGLKTSGEQQNRNKALEDFKCLVGERLGLFNVIYNTGTEIVLGEDDKHLNFRISLLQDKYEKDANKKNLTLTTAVKFNNWLGRLYFMAVCPFHKLIVPVMLKGIIKELERKNGEK